MGTLIAAALIVLMFVLLGSGLWIGLALIAVALIGMEIFTTRLVGDSMMLTIWSSSSSWSLTALPLFLWMGEILFRSRVASMMFSGLAPWVEALPGRLLHTNVVGCGIFAAISGSSAATCATIGKITLPELAARGYPERMAVGTLAGAGTLGLLIPPSIIMIVYGVATNVSIAKLFIAGIVPGILLAGLFMLYIMLWARLNPTLIPARERRASWTERMRAVRHLVPVILLIGAVLGGIYSGLATATEAAALGVGGALVLSRLDGTLSWTSFREGLFAACRVYCMIGLILAGASFLSLAMGFIGLPRELAEWIGSLGLSPFALMLLLVAFFVVLGCFLDGISMVVLTIAVLLPTVQAAGFDLIWFGIFIVLVVELAQITPPVGFNLFVLQALTGRQIPWIAYAALPFFVLMLLAVLLLWFFPGLALYLPSRL
jgi:tripartite ATP-independent transporter DctM subunit